MFKFKTQLMKLQKERIILLISVISAIILATFFWEQIIFNYEDPGIIGTYSQNNYDSKNDIFRYILFIGLPIFAFLSIKFYFRGNFIQKSKFYLKNNSWLFKSSKNSLIFFFLIIILCLDFFSLDFPNHSLDSYHDGQRLSAAYKSYIDNSLWSGSYITVGIFYEILSSKFIWELFDHVSIGLARFTEVFYIFILKVCLVYLSFLLTKFLKLKEFYKNIFFLINSIIFLNLPDYNIASVDLISFREIPVILLVILTIHLFLSKFQNFIIFLISLLSVLSLIWGIDRGLVCNMLIILISIYFIYLGDYRKFITLITYLILFWLIFYFFYNYEFNYFLNNTLSIYKEMNYIHGLIHPTPFSTDDNATRATKSLISIIICLLISINLFNNSEKKFITQLKVIMLFLGIISFLSYIYALGRSDGPHIKHTFGYPLIFFSIYFSYLFVFKISKLDFDLKKIYEYLVITIIFLFLFISPINFNLNNILNYKSRFIEFSYLPDSFFLNNEEIEFIDQVKPLISGYNCIQLFSNDSAYNYLLRKKSCTKFYFVWSASSLKKQKEFISELKNVNIVISNGPRENWNVPLKDRLFLVNDYLKRYYKSQKINKWNLLVLK
tara:strand:- start:4603 stop:6429 length:1827 start_codon:yes stop_codon:yes gene_type:complete